MSGNPLMMSNDHPHHEPERRFPDRLESQRSLPRADQEIGAPIAVQGFKVGTGSANSLHEPRRSGRKPAPSEFPESQSRLTSAATVQEFKARTGSANSLPGGEGKGEREPGTIFST